MRIGAFMYAHRLAGYGAIAPVYGEKCPFCGKEEMETAWHLLWRYERWAEYRTKFLGWMRSCQELSFDENPRGEKFLGIFLEGESNTSYDLHVKVTAAVAVYIFVVARVHVKSLHEVGH